ncbi:MAG: XRE family transcriptional regulator [Candidatus Omnitrophica bacterium]|nr:XRE family transcriptional regulator [Candidatus Omnitrophota bacterium]
MENFGEFFKEKRIAIGLTLRQFCELHDLDPGNISKIERSKMAPPTNEEKLRKYAEYLKIEIGSEEWQHFQDLAAISAGKIPADLKDHDTLVRLPVLFRKMRDGKFSEDELNEIIRKIKES